MFITLEGIEGSGKTTQLATIAKHLELRGQGYIITREPGGTAIGEQIRSILLDPENKGIVPRAELLLYMADRVQHVEERILPALEKGLFVLCDRYVDATIVYQGYARGIGPELVAQLHRMICGGLMPDRTLLLDLPVSAGLSRAWHQLDNGRREQKESRFEQERLDFHERVRAGYLDLSREYPDRYRVIDASREPQLVTNDILEILFPCTHRS